AAAPRPTPSHPHAPSTGSRSPAQETPRPTFAVGPSAGCQEAAQTRTSRLWTCPAWCPAQSCPPTHALKETCPTSRWDADSENRPTPQAHTRDRKSTRLNSSHVKISYAVFCLKKKNNK